MWNAVILQNTIGRNTRSVWETWRCLEDWTWRCRSKKSVTERRRRVWQTDQSLRQGRDRDNYRQARRRKDTRWNDRWKIFDWGQIFWTRRSVFQSYFQYQGRARESDHVQNAYIACVREVEMFVRVCITYHTLRITIRRIVRLQIHIDLHVFANADVEVPWRKWYWTMWCAMLNCVIYDTHGDDDSRISWKTSRTRSDTIATEVSVRRRAERQENQIQVPVDADSVNWDRAADCRLDDCHTRGSSEDIEAASGGNHQNSSGLWRSYRK